MRTVMSSITAILIFGLIFTQGSASAASGTFSRHGCIEFSTATVESESCQQLECIEKAPNGICKLSVCAKTQRGKYADTVNTGCTRSVDCGKGAYFLPGTPDEPESESTDNCDWRPCVETNPETGECESYECLSKRTTIIERTSYPRALCMKIPAQKVTEPSNRADSHPPTPSPTRITTSVPMPAGSPSQAVREMLTAAADYKDEYAAGISPEERLRRKAAGDRLDAFWGHKAMFREMLGEHWDTLKPSEKSEYFYLAAALIRKDRYPQMSLHLNEFASIEVLGEKKFQDGTTAVTVKMISKETGVTALPVFYLRQTDTGWRVYSVTSDGESLLLFYRQLHDTTIKEKGVEFLLSAMRKRLKGLK